MNRILIIYLRIDLDYILLDVHIVAKSNYSAVYVELL